MNTELSAAVLFEERPKQWGLRGDPYLWEDMKHSFSKVPITVSPEDFIEKLKEFFEAHTGVPLTRECRVFARQYAHGGMSSGQICGAFWVNQAIPLLLERLGAIQ